MSLPFSGPALPLKPSDLSDAAARLRCSLAAVRAVLTVETGSGGGYLPDASGRPKILFEAALFSRATRREYDSQYPDISCAEPDWHLYRGGAAEYERLARAASLNRDAALRSTSWGLFQILGENRALCGFEAVESFVGAMTLSEGRQVEAFTAFCLANGLARYLAALDWAGFAARYNGPSYRRNNYDKRLAAAYAQAVGKPDLVLRIGCTGSAVIALQAALASHGARLTADGDFGQVTELCLMHFQEASHLAADGIAGSETLAALGLSL